MLFEFLPREYKARAKKLYWMRLIALFGGGLLFISLSSILLLVPSYVLVHFEKKAVKEERDAIVNAITLKSGEVGSGFIDGTKAKINTAGDSLNKHPFAKTASSLVGAKINGIRITTITFERTAKENRITVEGSATRRDTLLAFVDALEKVRSFGEVNLPVSDLAKSVNINFTIQITEPI